MRIIVDDIYTGEEMTIQDFFKKYIPGYKPEEVVLSNGKKYVLEKDPWDDLL